jgi:hypothetical protein
MTQGEFGLAYGKPQHKNMRSVMISFAKALVLVKVLIADV